MKSRIFCCFIAVLSAGGCAQAEELKVFFGNLHSHTSYSDGSATPEEAYRHARDVAGLDFLAITEHNHSRAGRIANEPGLYNGSSSTSLISSANRFSVDGQFVALYGQEFSSISSGNHGNVFNLRDVISEADVPNGRWDILLSTWLPSHLDTSGNPALILLNHPATSSSPNSHEYGISKYPSFDAWRTALDARAQLINIVNGPSHQLNRPPGKASESEYRRYLNMGFHLGPTADQDNHKPNWGSAADTRTGVITTELSKASILAALRARHVYASEDKNLEVIAKIEGYLIGSRITGNDVPDPGSEIDIEISLSDPDEPFASYNIQIFSDQIGGDEDAGIVREIGELGSGVHSIDGVMYQGGHQYIFIRIIQTLDDDVGADRVWTAPVWFEPSQPDGDNNTNDAPVTTSASLTLSIDLVKEEATVFNSGTSTVDLSGWTIISTRGQQVYDFPAGTLIGPGQSLTVLSGPASTSVGEGELAWTSQNIWRNAGDPGELRDANDDLIASAP